MIQFDHRLFLQFTIIGLGGNGSHFFRGLCQDLRTHMNAFKGREHSRPFYLDRILLVDGDRVEEKNLGNQIFEEEEIGEFKVAALANRYGEHYRLNVLWHTEYIQDMSELHLLNSRPETVSCDFLVLPVIIGMVDNHATRKILHEYFMNEAVQTLVYLDAGIHEVEMEQGQQFKPETGNNGQIVVGLKYRGSVILEPVASVYPEILEDSISRVPGCGVVANSAPQRVSTNKTAAQIANNIITTLLAEKVILHHHILFDSRKCWTRPISISEEQLRRYEMARSSERKMVI